MELFSDVVDILNAAYSPSMMVVNEWLLSMLLMVVVVVLWFAICAFRKPSESSKFSTAFYVKKERYGVSVMEDQPYDYIKQ